MEKVKFILKEVKIDTKARLKITNFMDKEFIIILVVINIQVYFFKVKNKVKEKSNTKIKIIIKEIFKMVNFMAKENLFILNLNYNMMGLL